jgi:hypothetical protein
MDVMDIQLKMHTGVLYKTKLLPVVGKEDIMYQIKFNIFKP